MIFNYCTCSLDPKKERDTKNGRTPYRKVLTCAEGICNNCGHYTVAAPSQYDPASGQLYKYITGFKTTEKQREQKRSWYANNRT
jgi:hypothetical protein